MNKKIMLVTGASRGIGAQIAIAAGKEGYTVGVNYASNKTQADQVVQEIKAAGGDAFAIQADCGKEADIIHMFNEVDKHGTLDVLVANAGIIGGQTPIEDLQLKDLRQMIDVNVIGLILCSREAVKRMSTQRGGKGGAIIMISSAAARTGGIAQETHYAASKGAVDSFNLGLAKEVGKQGIRVASIRPGLIRTDIHEAHGGLQAVEQWLGTVPLGRAGDPAEVANAVIWLASPQASYVHGAIIDVSGGR